MLPNITLQLGELTSFDTSANDLSLVPEGADSLEANFADVLHRSTGAEVAGDLASGQLLPSGGNDLPLLPISIESLSTPDPEVLAGDTSADAPVEASLTSSIDPSLIESLPEANAKLDSLLVDPFLVDQRLMQALTNINSDADLLAETLLAVETDLDLSSLDLSTMVAENPIPPAIDVRAEALTTPDVARAATTSALSGEAVAIARDFTPKMLHGDKRHDRIFTSDSTRLHNETALHNPVTTRNVGEAAKATARVAETLVPPSLSAEPDTKLVAEGLPAPAKSIVTPGLQAQVAGADPNLVAPSVSRFNTEASVPVASQTLSQTPNQTMSQTISIPVQQSGWDQAISERVLLMTNGKFQNAEIRLTPAELGPLRIQVAVEDGAANVSFQAQHALTREALEQAMPRLRELLAEQGLSLGQTEVSDEGRRQGLRDEPGRARSNETVAAQAEFDEEEEGSTPRRSEPGLLDTFV